MKKLFRPQMPPNTDPLIQKFVNDVCDASQSGDNSDIAGAFTITGTFTPTRTLNVTSPTLANTVAVLATLISDLKAGGANRTT